MPEEEFAVGQKPEQVIYASKSPRYISNGKKSARNKLPSPFNENVRRHYTESVTKPSFHIKKDSLT